MNRPLARRIAGRALIAATTLVVVLAAVVTSAQQGARPNVAASGAGRRLALVVGNDRYSGPLALQNARRDAGAIAAELRAIGFQTTLVEDATRARLTGAIEALTSAITPRDIVLFYYAGHGAQIRGENYLIPIDYAGNSEERLALEGVSATQIQGWLARAQVSILVLDACRNNPYTGQRAAGGGLAPMEARGSLVAFATGAGQTAGDNPSGGQGTFTGALLETLQVPGLPIRDVFFRVRQRVYELTQGRQFPAIYDGLLGDVVLRPAASASGNAPAVAPPPPGPAVERPSRPPIANRTTPPPGPVPSSAVPSWLLGDFRGVNPITKVNTELTVHEDGSITGVAGGSSSRQTNVQYQWIPATQQIRDATGAYVFDVERSDDGFRTRQVGAPSNAVDYRRVYLPPIPPSLRADQRGLNLADRQRAATPDELAAMLAVVNEWAAAWATLDGPAGLALYPTWDVAAVRADRAKNGIETVVPTVTCTSATVRRDQARVPCRVSMQIEYKRQWLASRGSSLSIGQRPTSRTQVTSWIVMLFWNGSTWLIESL
jgi:hypothetical protein